MAEGTDRDVRVWQGPPLPQRGFGPDEPVSQPGAARASYIRPPKLVLEATRKAENMLDEASSAKKLQGDYETERKASGHHQASIKLGKNLRRVLGRRSTTWQAVDKVQAHRIQ
ncbi:hypothetical protein HPB52_005226 [Rhipicephalus sanguineus]|uniref:Uncharacterized protein n=1 Tax=Rhipicephalus sanguineus TaxID=34632 RepID=A0A9D4PGD1_RHISA|nr:hypothetical protein HPB52_005226 [Rhipicephalus sanguineus]